MLHGESLGLLVGAVALGAVHGVEPGHGWPVAASYALDRANKWVYGLAASLLIGVGHLVSSIAMVAAFFYFKGYFDLARVDQPVQVLGVSLGGPVSIVAGVLLIALGIREYTHHHDHGEGHHDEAHSHHGENHEHNHHHGENHEHQHDESNDGLWTRLTSAIPFLGGQSHSHGHFDDGEERSLLGIAWFAFLLGFAHEEEFEIIALCAGSTYCLELMTAYAVTVVVGIVGLTMLLIAGYERYEERVRRFTPYLPAFSAAVLILMGLGFVTGLF